MPHGELTAKMARFRRETKKKKQFEGAWQTNTERDRQTDRVNCWQ